MNHPAKKSRFAARAAAFLLALVCLCFCALPAFAEGESTVVLPPSATSAGALIYNVQYERILYEKNGDAPIYPASFAKIMTAILCYEYLADLGTSLTVTVTEADDLSTGGLGLKVGEELDFEVLLNALVVGSANDAALVLARVVSGTIEDFVTRMNERAEELGALSTVFSNPTGLHDANAQTTLTDMAKICSRAYEINDYMQDASQVRYEVAPTNLREKKRTLTNSNFLLNPRADLGYYVEDAMGINHGYTPQSGYCVASVRESGGAINLVLVAGGIKNEAKQNTALLDAMALFSYAENAFRIATILKKESVVCETPVKLSDSQDHVLLITADEITALLPASLDVGTDVEQRIYLREEELTAPVTEGTAYGSLELYYEGELLGSCELVAQRSLARSTSLFLLDAVEQFLQLSPVRFVLFVLAAVILLFLILCVILLLLRERRRDGLTPRSRRERSRRERELLRAERERQRAYFRTQRAANLEKLQEFQTEMAEAKARRERAQQAARRREAERQKRLGSAAARDGKASARRPMPRPAEGSERRVPRPAEGSERTPPEKMRKPNQNPQKNAPKKESAASKRPKQQ